MFNSLAKFFVMKNMENTHVYIACIRTAFWFLGHFSDILLFEVVNFCLNQSSSRINDWVLILRIQLSSVDLQDEMRERKNRYQNNFQNWVQ